MSSSLSAFGGENSITANELNATLHTYKVKVLVLEGHMKKQRAHMKYEFREKASEKDQLHKVELEDLNKEQLQDIQRMQIESQEKITISEQQRLEIK